jgi:hypothetical protein
LAYGGGIYINNSSPQINQCNILNNRVEGWSSYGGGIHIQGISSHPLIVNCEIIDNFAYNWGGGVFIESDASPTIENSIIYNNSFENDGGAGIYAYNSGIITIKNSIIYQNHNNSNNLCENFILIQMSSPLSPIVTFRVAGKVKVILILTHYSQTLKMEIILYNLILPA